MEFTKMHGLGNDFVMIDNREGSISLSSEEIVFLCDRHKGVGADGVILLELKDSVDCFMNYYNADGTVAEMCGNGIRCIAQYFLECTGITKEELFIGTRSGTKKIICHDDGTYSVDMGIPEFNHEDFPNDDVLIEELSFSCVSMGNPHAVTFVDSVSHCVLSDIGPRIEYDSRFPRKINVEFVEILDRSHLQVSVWERGCGATQACGTGACAVYAVSQKKGLIDGEITIHLPGGDLQLSQNENGSIVMRGSATKVFSGKIKF